MTLCAVIDVATQTLVNMIVAEATDPPPNGCVLVEIPDGCFWSNGAVRPTRLMSEVDASAELETLNGN